MLHVKRATFIIKQHQKHVFFFHVVSISLGFQVQDLPSPHTPSEAVAPTGCHTARPHRRACWLWSPGGREQPPRPYDWPGHRATPGYPPNTTFQTLVPTSGHGLGVNATNGTRGTGKHYRHGRPGQNEKVGFGFNWWLTNRKQSAGLSLCSSASHAEPQIC